MFGFSKDKTPEGPSVGVVIRTKDRPFFVARALAAVQAQSYPNWHIVLVNDGGDAAALAQRIAAQAADLRAEGRLTVLDLTPGLGRSGAFNRGVAALDTDLVACLDDDDTWSPDYMAALVAFYTAHQSEIADLGGVACHVTALREEIVDSASGPELRILGEDGLAPAFQRNEFFLNPLAYAVYRQDIYPVQWLLAREKVLELGGFPESFDVMEDRAFLNRFLARYRLAFLDRKLAFHHRRAGRLTDTERDPLLNTLDNPSYDWRQFADRARPEIDLGRDYARAAVVRSLMADLLAEVNYETSAIWQKVDGEMKSLAARLERDHAELLAALSTGHRKPAQLAPRNNDDEDAGFALYDLWQALGAQGFAGHLIPGVAFAKRLSLSRPQDGPGLLCHARPRARRLNIQVPDTGEWTALECGLSGLAAPGQALEVVLHLAPAEPYLFETALMTARSEQHEMSALTVHSCDATAGALVRHVISADWLATAEAPKFSLILPRQARNFSLALTHFLVRRATEV